jgi:hypothetical protein
MCKKHSASGRKPKRRERRAPDAFRGSSTESFRFKAAGAGKPWHRLNDAIEFTPVDHRLPGCAAGFYSVGTLYLPRINPPKPPPWTRCNFLIVAAAAAIRLDPNEPDELKNLVNDGKISIRGGQTLFARAEIATTRGQPA